MSSLTCEVWKHGTRRARGRLSRWALVACGPSSAAREGRREPWWLPEAGRRGRQPEGRALGRRRVSSRGLRSSALTVAHKHWTGSLKVAMNRGLWRSRHDSDDKNSTCVPVWGKGSVSWRWLWSRFHSIHASLILSLDTLSWQSVVGQLHFSKAGRIVVLIAVT